MSALQVSQQANGPWDVAATFTTLVTHAVPGLEHVNQPERTLSRTINGAQWPNYCPHVLTVRFGSKQVHLQTETVSCSCGLTSEKLVQLLRWWFDLDTDIARIDAHLAADQILAHQIHRRPGVRITRMFDPDEAVLGTIVGQQVTLKAALTFTARLVQHYGQPASNYLMSFPQPDRVARADPAALRAHLGLTQARTHTLQSAAALLAQHQFRSGLVTQSTPTVFEPFAAVKGIGPWTMGYLGVRASSQTDIFPSGDAVLRRALSQHTPPEQEQQRQAWSPYRSYASVRLWLAQLEQWEQS